MSSIRKTPTGPFHSGYGCAIFIIMVLTFSAIIGWAAYTLFKQDREIAGFTVEDARPLPAVVVNEAEKTTLCAKLTAFAQATGKNDPADLTLTIADMNALLVLAQDHGIGNQDGSAPYVEMLRMTSLDAKEKLFRTDLRLPVNKLPLVGKGTRHIVGTATFQPVLEGNSFEVKLQNITVPGKTVSEGFLHQLRQLPWLSVAKLKPEIAGPLGKVTSFDIAADGGSLILHAAPAVKKEDSK